MAVVRNIAFALSIVCLVSSTAFAQDEPETLDVDALYRTLRPSFVVVRCMGERFGTGFGIGRAGRIATARHVVACARGLAVELRDGTLLEVRVAAMASEHDVALLEIIGPRAAEVPPLPVREEPAVIGEEVISVGFPVGPEENGPHELAVSRGIVGQRTDDRIVHDALISPGSSGGPLLDGEGRAIGLSFAVPRGSAMALAVPISHLSRLHRVTPENASDPRDPFRFGFDVGLLYEVEDVVPFHFAGIILSLWASAFDQFVATLNAVALGRFPRTLEDGGVLVEGNRFAGELDLGYRLRIDNFPLVFELAGGISIASDHVDRTRYELSVDDPTCDPSATRCPVSLFGVRTGDTSVLARPLLTLRISLGPVMVAYTALFDVERIEATAHRVTLRVGIF